jgi:topoisomerase-4 subunit A
MIYVDGKTGRAYAKRFNVTAVTRDKEYDLSKGAEGSRVVYLSANPNGESEIVEVHLSSGSRARIKVFDYDFSELAIKGRGSKGNMVTKYPVRKVVLKEVGKSTLGAQKLWMDTASGRLNQEERGTYLGSFDTGDLVLVIYRDGSYAMSEVTPTTRFEAEEVMWIGKYKPDCVISALYHEGEKGWTMVKRFNIETTSTGQRFKFITEHRSSKLYYATADGATEIRYATRAGRKKQEHALDLAEFIDVKGWKALGNKLSEYKILSAEAVRPDTPEEPVTDDQADTAGQENGQTTLFPDDAPAKKPAKKSTRKKKTTSQPVAKKTPKTKVPAAKKRAAKSPAKKKQASARKAAKKKSPRKKASGGYKAGDTIEFDL